MFVSIPRVEEGFCLANFCWAPAMLPPNASHVQVLACTYQLAPLRCDHGVGRYLDWLEWKVLALTPQLKDNRRCRNVRSNTLSTATKDLTSLCPDLNVVCAETRTHRQGARTSGIDKGREVRTSNRAATTRMFLGCLTPFLGWSCDA